MIARLLRWFLAHDPTTACTWQTELEAENVALHARVRELELAEYMRTNAADVLLAGTPIADDITFRRIVGLDQS